MIRSVSIALNGSMLDEKPTGVGVYTYNLINMLRERSIGRSELHYTIFSPTYMHLTDRSSVVKLSGFLQSSRHGKWSAVTRFFWNSCIYPFQTKDFDLSISPTTHGSLFGRHQIITIHDLLSLRFDNVSHHQRSYFRFILPLMVRKAKAIVAVSESTKADIVRYLHCEPEKVTVIYNGYDRLRFFPIPATDVIFPYYQVRDYLLAVGPTYPHKNFERLLEAYAGLDKKTRERHPLLIVGGLEPYLGKIRFRASELGLGDAVRFTGYVPDEHMPYLYREALALVFPSLYEGFGFPLLEAMACGCPVLCSRTSSMPEVCGTAASYFDPLSATAIRSTMETALSNPEFRSTLSDRGLLRVRAFSWEKTAESLIDLIYKQLTPKTTENV